MAQLTKFKNFIPQDANRATLLLYGDVGDWGDITAKNVVSELMLLSQNYKAIDIHINSGGGDVFTGIAIYNALRTSQVDIRIYVDGIAASIAGIIALCGKPLYMSRYARLMIHKVSGAAYGSSSELRQTAELIDSLQSSLIAIISERSTLSLEEVESRFFKDEADHWLTAEEAKSLGMIDGIVELEDEPTELKDDSTKEHIYQAFTNRLTTQAQKQNDMNLLNQIQSIPSLSGVSESNLKAKLEELNAKAEEAETLKRENQELRDKLQKAEDEERKALVSQAIQEGRISEAQKDYFLKLLATNRSEAEGLLASFSPNPKPYPRAKDYTQPQSSGSNTQNQFQGKSWQELDRQGLLTNFKEQDPELDTLEGFRAFRLGYLEGFLEGVSRWQNNSQMQNENTAD